MNSSLFIINIDKIELGAEVIVEVEVKVVVEVERMADKVSALIMIMIMIQIDELRMTDNIT